VRHKASPGPAHLLYGELDPEVVTLLAIVERGHNPRDLRSSRIIGRVVVATVVCELLHADGVSAPEAQLTKALLPVVFDDFFGPHGHVVGVLPCSPPSAALAEQVPALVQSDFDLPQPFELLLRKLLALV
jgi:hypothetical protein